MCLTKTQNETIAALARSLDPLKEQLHMEMVQRLTATDKLMKDNLGALVRSRVSVRGQIRDPTVRIFFLRKLGVVPRFQLFPNQRGEFALRFQGLLCTKCDVVRLSSKRWRRSGRRPVMRSRVRFTAPSGTSWFRELTERPKTFSTRSTKLSREARTTVSASTFFFSSGREQNLVLGMFTGNLIFLQTSETWSTTWSLCVRSTRRRVTPSSHSCATWWTPSSGKTSHVSRSSGSSAPPCQRCSRPSRRCRTISRSWRKPSNNRSSGMTFCLFVALRFQGILVFKPAVRHQASLPQALCDHCRVSVVGDLPKDLLPRI